MIKYQLDIMLKTDLKKITSLFFTSRVRLKIMTLFYTHPQELFHMREIARTIDEQINAVRRELISMEKTEFLLSKKDGIKKYFLLNPDFPYYGEFRSIVMKSFGLGYHVFKNKKALGDVKFAILTHTYLNHEKSDETNLDMLIVGEPDMKVLEESVRDAQQLESKEIFYSVISEKELEVRKKRKDSLIYSMSVLPRAMVIGTDEAFVM
jgi:hypothetical protein